MYFSVDFVHIIIDLLSIIKISRLSHRRASCHMHTQIKSPKPTFKLFPSVCASQILWKFVPNCWSTHAETAVVKRSGLCAWDDDVTVVQ